MTPHGSALPGPADPIFAGGCSRSGTTLLGAMLGAHPRCVAIPEAQFLPECRGAVARGEVAPCERAVYGWVRRHPRFRRWRFDPDPAGLSAAEDPQATARVMRWLAGRWAAEQGKPGAELWVDHTPTHLRWGETLRRLFPTARFIHLVRDGRGVAASLMTLPWGPCDPASAARFWARAQADGLALESHLGDGVLRVRFEDLLGAPEAALTRIAAHAGVAYDPAMLAADGFQPTPAGRAQHRLIGRPPDASRAEAWRSKLSAREVEIFESVAGDLLSHLGYEPDFGPRARPPSRGERLRFALRDLWRRRLLWPLRRRLMLRRR